MTAVFSFHLCSIDGASFTKTFQNPFNNVGCVTTEEK